MKLFMEWHRMVNDQGEACGSVQADADTVFDSVDTLENTLPGLGWRLSFTRREKRVEDPSDPPPDIFLFNGDRMGDILGIDERSIPEYTSEMIVRAALKAVEMETGS